MLGRWQALQTGALETLGQFLNAVRAPAKGRANVPVFVGPHPSHWDKIICPKRGQQGYILWDEIPLADGTDKQLNRIEGPFYERIARRDPYPIELVCHGCGTAQPEEPLSP